MEESMSDNSLKRKRVISDLIQGREFATQLQILLQNPFQENCSVSAEKLVMKILGSFTQTLSLLNSDHGSAGCNRFPAAAQVGSSCSGDQDSGNCRKGPAVMDRRGRYKRRKNSEARTIISPTTEDRYAWRKYGQKVILNDKYPRCYFRCTHKFDRDCKALKQVQQIDEEDNTTMYHITYFGHHTCKGTKKPSTQLLKREYVEPLTVNFESTKAPISLQLAHHSPLKEETNISSDSFLWKDLMALEPSHLEDDVLSSVHDSCASTNSIGLDILDLIGCVDFDKDFKFDETEFF